MPTQDQTKNPPVKFDDLPDAPWPGTPVKFDDLPDAPWPGTPREMNDAEVFGHKNDASPTSAGELLSGAHEAGVNALSGAFKSAYESLNPFSKEREKENPFQQTLRTGRGLLSAAAVPFAYPIAAAASPIAHGLTGAIRAAGEPIAKGLNPEAKLPTHEDVYRQVEPDVETALGTAGAKGPVAPRMVMPRGSLLTTEGQGVLAGRALEKAAKSPIITEAEQLVPGSKPTTFQASGDMGLGSLERGMAAKYPAEFMQRRAEQNTARLQALQNIQDIGEPTAVAEHFRNLMRADDIETENTLKQAEFRAWQQANDLGGMHDPDTYGQILRRDLEVAEQNARNNERTLWRAIDPNERIRCSNRSH